MVFIGLQYAFKEYLINMWNNSFFSKPKEQVIKKFSRTIANYLGITEETEVQKMMSKLHDLGYLPIRIKALPEGAKVGPGIPVFTVKNTKPGFGPLVNYIETILSNTVWPMCNSASLMEQYYLLAKHYCIRTGASEEFWLPFAIHNFAMRGHRGLEDAIISAFGHALFHKGSDTFGVIDFAEEYYGADSDKELIVGSVNASEHATVCQQIAYYGGGHDGEVSALRHFLTDVYPTGIFSYVSDSRNYWDVVGNVTRELKDVIINRGPTKNGQPGVLTLRPDSSVDTPYEVLLGYKFLEVESLVDDYNNFADGDYEAVKYHGKYYIAYAESDVVYSYGESYGSNFRIELGRELNEFEAKGTIQTLWDIFGGTEVEGSGVNPDGSKPKFKLLDSHIRVIYGEAISLAMGEKIYKGMLDAGWCVGNVFFGVGSWAFIANSSRDSYGIACKATNSVIDGVEVPLQKDPIGTSTFKKSAKGLLRVEFENGNYVLYDEQTPEQEEQGELIVVFEDSKTINESTLQDIRARVA